MSSLDAFNGARAGAAGGLGGRKRGRPLGSLNKAKDPAAMPPVPWRRGRPPGSRNKKTLEALAVVAAAEPFGASHSTAIVAAPGGAVAVAVGGVADPAATTSVASLTGTPLEAAAALIGAAMVFGAAPPGLAGLSIGGSSSAAASEAQARPPRPPTRQRLSYVPKHGFATSVVPLLAGCKEHLPLPASFIGTMGKNPPNELHGGGWQRRPASVPR
jgi:hypothetical protein